MKAAIYQLDTGAISRFIDSPPDQVAQQCLDGEEFFLNSPAGATHIINHFPTVLLEPPATIEMARQLKRVSISIEFDRALSSGRTLSSLGFYIDARRSGTKNDLQNMEELASQMAAYSLETTTITDADDIDHEGITLDQVNTLANEIRTYVFTLFAAKRSRVAALLAASTPEEIDAI
jgi:hypothetical protein